MACIICGLAVADNITPLSLPLSEENNQTASIDNRTSLTGNETPGSDMNLTGLMANESAQYLAEGSADEEQNQTGVDGNQTMAELNTTGGEKAAEKPVYKLSIGSVYSSDYKEPEGRTFTTSGCGA